MPERIAVISVTSTFAGSQGFGGLLPLRGAERGDRQGIVYVGTVIVMNGMVTVTVTVTVAGGW
jgi:hypothetical protein